MSCMVAEGAIRGKRDSAKRPTSWVSPAYVGEHTASIIPFLKRDNLADISSAIASLRATADALAESVYSRQNDAPTLGTAADKTSSHGDVVDAEFEDVS